ncbi:DNA-3-methyladenine glycosylase I [bacterium]|nr:MAG: DNA-3-methyladenine glycosylase I [bacterium]
MQTRCAWAGKDPLMVAYHDREWGVPEYDERRLFEFLVLEGAQAGLSWSTVLKKREAYRRCFDDFDPERVARYTARRVERLLEEPGIVRNRLKIESAITNARAFLELREREGDVCAFLWSFAPSPRGRPLASSAAVPVTTRESEAMSKELKRRGFRFVGSTICYAFMQAVGMANDHVADCFRSSEIRRKG